MVRFGLIKKYLLKIYPIIQYVVSKYWFKVISVEEIADQYNIEIFNINLTSKQNKNNLDVISCNDVKKNELIKAHELISNQNFNKSAKIYKIKGNKFRIVQGGYVIYDNRNVLLESAHHQNIYFWRYKRKIQLLFSFLKNAEIHENVFIFNRLLDFNFWHSTAEILAELNLVLNNFQDIKKFSVIIKSNLSNVHIQQLNLLFEHRITLITEKKTVKAQNIFLTSNSFEIRSLENYNIMNRNFSFWFGFNKLFINIQTCLEKDKITLVSRKNSQRTLLNEFEIIHYFKGKITCVILDECSWFEQLQIINNSKYLIAVHGAVSANLLFSKPSYYLEIIDLDRNKGLFPLHDVISICLFNNINHIILDVNSQGEREDYLVNISQLENIIELN